jgi:hypothetical protein
VIDIDDDLLARLRELADRTEIFDCMTRYARGMDRLDRDLVRSAYHDDAIDDHVTFVGPVGDFIDWAFAYHATQVRHQHYVTNHCVDIQGDEAHAETYYVFVGTDRDPAEPLTMVGGRYIDRLERRDDRWAIAARRCLVEWSIAPDSQGGPGVELDRAGGGIARDRSDPSYERPLRVRSAPEF